MRETFACMLRWVPVFLMGLASLTGCGPRGLEGTIPIRGQVTYRGAPVPSGEVRYLPTQKTEGRVARGTLDQDGNFELTTLRSGDGALPGNYRIVILAPDQSTNNLEEPPTREVKEKPTSRVGRPSLVPLKYANPERSGLGDTVNEEHSGFILLELED